MTAKVEFFPLRKGESLTDWTLRLLSDVGSERVTMFHNFPADGGSVVTAETGRDSRGAGNRFDNSAIPRLQIVRGK